MDPSFVAFVRQFTGVITATALSVILTAFVSIPYTLQSAMQGASQAAERHFT